jgi:hypothetical protein
MLSEFPVTRHGASQVADRGDGLQILRVAVNILNKKLQTADRGRSSSLGVGQGLTTPTVKNKVCFETSLAASDLDGFVGTGKWLRKGAGGELL